MKLYTARDENGELFIFSHKPIKGLKIWLPIEGDCMRVDDKWFHSVKWEDEEPTEITLGNVNPK